VEPRRHVALAVEQLLLLPHQAEVTVVEQHDLDGDPLLDRGRELLHVHQEAAVAREADHAAIGRGERRPDRRRQPEPHRAEATRGEPLSWAAEGEALRHPHLVLPHVARHDRVVPRPRGHVVDDAVRIGGLGAGRRRERMLVADRTDAGRPCGSRASLEPRQRRLDRSADVAVDAHRRALDLAELGAVHVHVYDARVRAERRGLADRAVVEAHPEREQQIALVEHQVGERGGVHAHHAEREWMLGWQDAETVQRRCDRGVDRLGERSNGCRCVRDDDARTGEYHRTVGLVHEPGRRRDRIGIGRRWSVRPPGIRERVHVDRLLLHVLGHVDHHGSGAPRCGDTKRRRHHVQQLLGRLDEPVVLRDREGHAVGVDLLERVRADRRARHLARDRDQRDRVELRVGDCGHEVRGARAGGAEAHRRLARHARHPLGDESGALLVAGEHVPKPAPVQGVVHGQVRATRNTGHGGDALTLQERHDDLGAGTFHVGPLPSRSVVMPAGAGRWGPRNAKPPPTSRRQGFRMDASLSPLRRDGVYADDDDQDEPEVLRGGARMDCGGHEGRL